MLSFVIMGPNAAFVCPELQRESWNAHANAVGPMD